LRELGRCRERTSASVAIEKRLLMPDAIDVPRFSRVATNGINLHIAEAGSADGDLLFLLHGFPEFWYGWRNHIGRFAAAGFRVVVPDQRGYNLSDKPKGVAAYDLDQVCADIVGLAEGFGRRTFNIIGHDWGAAVGWWTATRYADRIERFAALNAPHPAVWYEAMRNNPLQRRRSRYVRFFAIPYLPELLLRQGNFRALSGTFKDAIRPDAFTENDLRRYRAAWSQPGALVSMINWYRALLRKQMPASKQLRVGVPTLIIWGTQDSFAERELADASARLCDDARVTCLERSTHWVQHDEPERVGDLLLEFLKP
jgi:epoxide hydrolase 4